MGSTVKRLKAAQVQHASEPGRYYDGGGLWLRVASNGGKGWLFRYERDGKRYELWLGSTAKLGLAAARKEADEARHQLNNGLNPVQERIKDRQARKLASAAVITFSACCAAYIDAHRPAWKNAKHAQQWGNTLASYCTERIGDKPVADVDTPDLVAVLSPIWLTKHETASRLRGRMESVLGWAATMGYRSGENPARWRGHLENLLPAVSKRKLVEHHAALPWQNMPDFMRQLREVSGMGARALEFAILTAARSGEVRLATWSEIDLAAQTWTVPAQRMKAGRDHRVPLSDEAAALLRALPRLHDEWVFPSTQTGKPLSDMTLTAALRRMAVDATAHGFRSTFRDWAAEQTNYPREVAEHALAHQLPDRVEAAYRRSDLIDKRRLLMRDWAAWCCSGCATS